jgi:hypothetical protein
MHFLIANNTTWNSLLLVTDFGQRFKNKIERLSQGVAIMVSH